MTSVAQPSNAVRPFGSEESWKQVLREAIREVQQLLDYVGVEHTAALQSCRDFPTFVTRPFADRIRRGDAADPLLLQVLPRHQEGAALGLTTDAVGDRSATKVEGLVQKYRGRALLMATGSCAIHCRYCFRRAFPYETVPRGSAGLEPALQAIGGDPSISEVILSGGDPLMLDDGSLDRLVQRLIAIPHVRRLRFHTRLPIVAPSRVTTRLSALLEDLGPRAVVVLHVNHPNEIDEAVQRAAGRIRNAGAHLLNQSVLLRNVNDSVQVLSDLSDRLLDVGITPYYLHVLDLVDGVQHFATNDDQARSLHQELLARLPGYAVPRLVRESPGRPSKTPLYELP